MFHHVFSFFSFFSFFFILKLLVDLRFPGSHGPLKVADKGCHISFHCSSVAQNSSALRIIETSRQNAEHCHAGCSTTIVEGDVVSHAAFLT